MASDVLVSIKCQEFHFADVGENEELGEKGE
jgi:hypothetical protein